MKIKTIFKKSCFYIYYYKKELLSHTHSLFFLQFNSINESEHSINESGKESGSESLTNLMYIIHDECLLIRAINSKDVQSWTKRLQQLF